MKCVGLVLISISILARGETENFDGVPLGRLPPGWRGLQTGRGKADWSTVQEPTAPSRPNVLKQSGTATYPVCVKTNTELKNGFVAVKFMPLAGKEDQAGGVVWRYRDPDNYYVARANALENNVTIYHTLHGKRTELKRVPAEVSAHRWHSLRVDFADDHFTVTFDGRNALEIVNDKLRESGAVGVWTKADSITVFDDFAFGSGGPHP